ncbi:MAG: lipoate--protein ligase family protein [Candidatus Heimdallarchaeota archaeon]|nr:lipoate--protein ligase family protein [Candidatus Heimdallarchaeota archaeon]
MAREEWRLIWEEKASNCYYNMGLDRAILNAVSKKKVKNTIRFYRWQPSAVSIGYFQSMKKVVDIDKCKELGVDYVRRITGGGAVYHDFEGELTYSINCLEENKKLPQEIMKIYEKICGGIIVGMEKLGVQVEFKPINDIVLKSSQKKISGNALTRREGVVLQHGTILRKVNLEKMFSVLKIPDEKYKTKMISSAKERVSSLELELGTAPSFKEIKEALKAGFEETLEIDLVQQEITAEELKEAQEIANNVFRNEEWLFKR